MRLVAFEEQGRGPGIGIEADGQIRDLSSHANAFPDLASLLDRQRWGELRELAMTLPRLRTGGSVKLLPPLAEGARIFCVGINYLKTHPIAGQVSERPPQPTIFVKLPEAVVGHLGTIEHPADLSEQLDYEGELAVVIGEDGRSIAEADALRHVAGYTILDDGSVRDWQKNSLFTGKNFYRSSSLGPAIVTADAVADAMKLTLITRINNEEVQRTSTAVMLFSISEIISHISRFTPLRRGDVIATGSPHGSGGGRNPQRWLKPGDLIEIEISDVGILQNTIGRSSA